MDWTLIKSKSGRTFQQNEFDWQWWHERVPTKLRRINSDGFRVVIFTNQGGVASGKRSVAQLKTQFRNMQAKLGLPLTFMAAMGPGDD